MTYTTTRSKRGTFKLWRNLVIQGAGFLLFGYMAAEGFVSGSGWIGALLISLVFGILAAFIFVTLQNTKHPLVIKEASVVIGGTFRVEVPASQIKAVVVPKGGADIALEYANPEKTEPQTLRLPWNFIAEPSDIVVAKLVDRFGEATGP